MRLTMTTMGVLLLTVAPALAAEPVMVTVEQKTHPIRIAPLAEDSLYPVRVSKERTKAITDRLKKRERQIAATLDTKDRKALKIAYTADEQWQKIFAELQDVRDSVYETKKITFPLVTLSNGHLEVKVAPTLGMRVVNAVDLRSGESLSGTPDPRFYEKQPFLGNLGWTAGYVEPSFPYFEHGVGTQQSAGYRVIEHENGSATVAMNMRFTHHQDKVHMKRYGRFSQRILSIWVTLKPGEIKYSYTTRVDNPNPLRRSDRMWTNVLMHAAKYDAQHIIYPAGWVSPHGAGRIDPFYADGGEPTWQGVSHFAVHPDYRFCGVYSPKKDTNALIILDRRQPRGMKLYTRNQAGGFLEIWTGHGYVFEDPGDFVQGYEPIEYTLHFYIASGIGRVRYADEHIAVGEKGSVATDTTKDMDYETPRPPLKHSDARPHLEKMKQLGGKYRVELEEISNHTGAPTSWQAVGLANKLARQETLDDAAYALSIARTAYRFGQFDNVLAIVEKVGRHPEADMLRGLIAWERGDKVDFGSAGIDANYHRALLAVQNDDTKVAIDMLDKLLAERPNVYRPALLRAYLKRDVEAAEALAEANPASPEAQLVLELLGVEGAAEARKALCEHNPDAAEQVQAFQVALTEGKWRHMKRYGPMAP